MKFLIMVIVFSLTIINCASRQGGGHIKINSADVSSNITFTGGNGDSGEEAVIINGVKKQSDGRDAEYLFISSKHGEKGKMWSVTSQSILKEKDKVYEIIEIRLTTPENDSRIYYFDVTSFPWKEL